MLKEVNLKNVIVEVAMIIMLFSILSCAQAQKENKKVNKRTTNQMINTENLETVTLGSGCFWCTEAIFENLRGVATVESGYAGGHVDNPTYRQVCDGTTGHAEVIQLTFDPELITFDEILEVFWQTHDPTTLNRQGADVGTQYRSVVFYHNEKQKELAEKYKKQLDAEGVWSDPIVTEISPLSNYYKAEDYHQEYFRLNGSQPYCSFVVRPKVEKFKKIFKDKLK